MSEASTEQQDAGQEQGSEQQQNDSTQNGGQQGGTQRTDLESLPADVKALIADLRRENATTRTKAKEQTQSAAQQAEQATLQRLAVALGLKGDEKPDAEKLSKDLESRTSKLRETQTQLAVIRTAAKVKGDPEALLDSNSVMSKIGKLDPDDEDYSSEVERILAEAVKNNPRLGLGTSVGAGGRDMGSAGSASGQDTRSPDRKLADGGKPSDDDIREIVRKSRRMQ